jgi:Flp pilus assembly pilin Flp
MLLSSGDGCNGDGRFGAFGGVLRENFCRGAVDLMKPLVLELIKRFFRDEAGGLHTVEFILIGTLVSIGVIVGLAEYRNAVVQEYGDVSAALQHLDQSWTLTLVTSGGPVTYSYSDTMTYSGLNADGVTVTSPAGVE